MRELTKDTVRQLITEILIYDKKRVEIHFKFKNEWENLLEMTGIDLLQKNFNFSYHYLDTRELEDYGRT